MDWLRRATLLIGMLVCLLLGGFILFVAGALHEAADVGRPVPRTVSLAELSDKGCGDNAHVALTDFTFGKPVIEKDSNGWKYVWLPLEPIGQRVGTQRPVVLRFGDRPDQTHLDQVLAGKPTALVTSSLSKYSIWSIRPSDTFRKALPKPNPDKTLFLMSNPTVDVAGLTILSEDMIFDRSNARAAQVGAWVLICLGVTCAVLLVRGLNRQPMNLPSRPALPNEEYLRSRLLIEPALSMHEFRFVGALLRSLIMLFGAVLFLGFSFFALFMTCAFAARSEPIFAALSGILTLSMFVGVFLLFGMVIKMFTACPQRIALCPSGLRWRKFGRDRAALWSDVARCHRFINVRDRSGPILNRMDNLVIVLDSGEALHFWSDSLSDYERFADAVGSECNDLGRRAGTDALNRALADCLPEKWPTPLP